MLTKLHQCFRRLQVRKMPGGLHHREPRVWDQRSNFPADFGWPQEIVRPRGHQGRHPDCCPIRGIHLQPSQRERQFGIGRRIVTQINPEIGRSFLRMRCRKGIGQAGRESQE